MDWLVSSQETKVCVIAWLVWLGSFFHRIALRLGVDGFTYRHLAIELGPSCPPAATVRGCRTAALSGTALKQAGRPKLLTDAEEACVMDSLLKVRAQGGTVDHDGLIVLAQSTLQKTRPSSAGASASQPSSSSSSSSEPLSQPLWDVSKSWSKSFKKRYDNCFSTFPTFTSLIRMKLGNMKSITSSRPSSTPEEVAADNLWRRQYEAYLGLTLVSRGMLPGVGAQSSGLWH